MGPRRLAGWQPTDRSIDRSIEAYGQNQCKVSDRTQRGLGRIWAEIEDLDPPIDRLGWLLRRYTRTHYGILRRCVASLVLGVPFRFEASSCPA